MGPVRTRQQTNLQLTKQTTDRPDRRYSSKQPTDMILIQATNRQTTLIQAINRHTTLIQAINRHTTLIQATNRHTTLIQATNRHTTLIQATNRHTTLIQAANNHTTLIQATTTGQLVSHLEFNLITYVLHMLWLEKLELKVF